MKLLESSINSLVTELCEAITPVLNKYVSEKVAAHAVLFAARIASETCNHSINNSAGNLTAGEDESLAVVVAK